MPCVYNTRQASQAQARQRRYLRPRLLRGKLEDRTEGPEWYGAAAGSRSNAVDTSWASANHYDFHPVTSGDPATSKADVLRGTHAEALLRCIKQREGTARTLDIGRPVALDYAYAIELSAEDSRTDSGPRKSGAFLCQGT